MLLVLFSAEVLSAVNNPDAAILLLPKNARPVKIARCCGDSCNSIWSSQQP